jgi:hypothetical protein
VPQSNKTDKSAWDQEGPIRYALFDPPTADSYMYIV